jgi:hypothetical protein
VIIAEVSDETVQRVPDAVLRTIYYQNALRHLASRRQSIERQLAARSRLIGPGR